MENNSQLNNWEEEFDKAFPIKEFRDTGAWHANKEFIKRVLHQAELEVIEKVGKMITDEIAIAHTKDVGGRTSRLTSLYMRVIALKDQLSKENI